MTLRQKKEGWRNRLGNTEETKNTNNQLKAENPGTIKVAFLR